jgi:hypothetical protein
MKSGGLITLERNRGSLLQRVSDDFKRHKNATCLWGNAGAADVPLLVHWFASETFYISAELLVSALPLPFRRTHPDVPPENPRKMASVRKSGFDRNLRYASRIEPQ